MSRNEHALWITIVHHNCAIKIQKVCQQYLNYKTKKIWCSLRQWNSSVSWFLSVIDFNHSDKWEEYFFFNVSIETHSELGLFWSSQWTEKRDKLQHSRIVCEKAHRLRFPTAATTCSHWESWLLIIGIFWSSLRAEINRILSTLFLKPALRIMARIRPNIAVAFGWKDIPSILSFASCSNKTNKDRKGTWTVLPVIHSEPVVGYIYMNTFGVGSIKQGTRLHNKSICWMSQNAPKCKILLSESLKSPEQNVFITFESSRQPSIAYAFIIEQRNVAGSRNGE